MKGKRQLRKLRGGKGKDMNALQMDAQIRSNKEEFVLSTERHGERRLAALKDVQIKPREEECA
eukprot:scaffold14691_cov152-Skeletonema_dohrnii-CCMP3373.AAC.11